MSDQSQLTCPECQTSQSSGAPFCENCGHRMGRRDKAEDAPARVSADVLRRARRKRIEAAERPPSASGGGQQSPAGAAGGADGSTDDANTFIEGLRSVGVDDESSRRDHATEPPTPAPAASGLPREPAAANRADGKLAVYMAGWLSLTAIAVLTTYFLTARHGHERAEPAASADLVDRVDVPGGPFLRGLDGEVRSFILQMCQKVDDDPKENCREDRLLSGEYPEETVELGGFELDATEVTVAEFEDCAGAGACAPVDYKSCQVWTHQGLQVALRAPKALQADRMPVSCVSLEQARDYCAWAGGELPSPDQWEKAARGARGQLFPWGNAWASDIANWGEMDVAQTAIVGKIDGFEWTAPPASFPEGVSPFGAYDMAGNVAEWVDGGDPLAGVARGGSWTSHPFELRVTQRLELDADARRTDVGFRCAYE